MANSTVPFENSIATSSDNNFPNYEGSVEVESFYNDEQGFQKSQELMEMDEIEDSMMNLMTTEHSNIEEIEGNLF